MNNRAITYTLVSVVFLLYSFAAHAAIITGELSYDNTGNHIITGSNGLTYLGWGEIANLNYSDTLATTQSGGAYSQYHLASQTEAFEFYNMSISPIDAVIDSGLDSQHIITPINAGWVDGNLGANETAGRDSAWFISDHGGTNNIGFVRLSGNDNTVVIDTASRSISSTDQFADGGVWEDTPITWLLVSDSAAVPIPERSEIALMNIGLLGFVLARRKIRK